MRYRDVDSRKPWLYYAKQFESREEHGKPFVGSILAENWAVPE